MADLVPRIYFAWCNDVDFGIEHQVYDSDDPVLGFTVTGKEGDFPRASITLHNKGIGLLAKSGQWCWLSYDDRVNPVKPVFHGRMIAVPGNMLDEQIQVDFLAKPTDFNEQKLGLAYDLAVLPAYDRLFIDPKLRMRLEDTHIVGDCDAVLEGYSKRYHVSRGGGEPDPANDGKKSVVTVSDIIDPEDGIIDFGVSTTESDHAGGVPYNSVNLTYETPMSVVQVKMQVDWTQTGSGPTIDLGSHTIPTYTQSLQSDWPKAGTSLGGGWMAAPGTIAADMYAVEFLQTVNSNTHWENKAHSHVTGDAMSLSVSQTDVACRGPSIKQTLTETIQPGIIETNFITPTGIFQPLPAAYQDENSDVINIPMHYSSTGITIPQSLVVTQLFITPETGRKRTEYLNFTLQSDIQPALKLPEANLEGGAPSENELIEITGADVTIPIDGVAPLTDPQVGSYFTTDRGLQSLEYGLLRARARLRAGARIAKLTFDCSFEKALQLSCRKGASLTHHRIPGGGYAFGKITGYTIFLDPASGKIGGTVEVMCAVGHGGGISAAAGDPDYVIDYVEDDYQQFVNQTALAGTESDVGYSPPAFEDGELTPFNKEDVVISETIHGSVEAQKAIIEAKAREWYKSGDQLDPVYANAPWWVQQWLAATTTQQDPRELLAAKEAAQKAQEELDSNAVWYELVLRSVDDLALANAFEIETTKLTIPTQINLEY